MWSVANLVYTWPLDVIPRVSTGEASWVGFEKVKQKSSWLLR